MSAMIWMAFWVLANADAFSSSAKITVCYDSEYAAGLASGWFSPHRELTMAHLLTSLMCAVSMVAEVEYHHIESHTGHPWNEFVDCACTAAS
eukprot:8799337-Karenia_brevis.AAC.1